MTPDITGTRDQLSTSLGRVWGTFVEGIEYRFDLFTVELQEESMRRARHLLALQLASFAIFLAFLSLNALLIVAFWENRIVVVAAMLGFYAVAGLLLAWRTFASIANAPPPFGATIGELRKDYESWRVER